MGTGRAAARFGGAGLPDGHREGARRGAPGVGDRMNSSANRKQVARLRQLVIRDPEIMRGTPVFKGTRIPVDLVPIYAGPGCERGRDS